MSDAAKTTSAPVRSTEASNSLPAPGGASPPSQGMTKLVLQLLQPYRGWLIIVFVAMLVETAMKLAAPWPLKIIIDSVVGTHKLPEWLGWMHDLPLGENKMGLAALAALGIVLIAVVGAIAS